MTAVLGCQDCGLVTQWARVPLRPRCPRCRARLAHQAPVPLQASIAYLVTAALLYIPSNLLPVMSTRSVLTGQQQHTLLGGIAELWASGSWELALIVFVASIVVPVTKMVVLALLIVSTHGGWTWRPRERTVLHRLIDSVGHWSMLDVYVVVILAGMVRFGAVASVEPEAGLLAFGAVVVLTMLAARAFDPRLIWRPVGANATVYG